MSTRVQSSVCYSNKRPRNSIHKLIYMEPCPKRPNIEQIKHSNAWSILPIISNHMCKSLDIKITGVDGRTVPGTKMPATSFKEPKSLISFVCHPNPHSSTPSLSHLQIWWPSRPKMWAHWPNFLANTTLSLSDKSFSISWVHGLYCQEEIKLDVLLHILKCSGLHLAQLLHE